MIKRIVSTIAVLGLGVLLTLPEEMETDAPVCEIDVEEVTEEVTVQTFLQEDIQENEIEEFVAETEQILDLGFAVAEVSGSVNVRLAPNTDSEIVGKIYDGAVAEILALAGEEEDWLQVTSGNVEGYVKGEFFLRDKAAEEYIAGQTELTYAKTMEEDRTERQARRAAEEKERLERYRNIEFPATSYTTNEELRKSVVEYALQYVGNKYVHGGDSLAEGTDCSGFTCFIYKDFGYSISRTPGGQLSSDGRSIAAEEMQPGDIICYSSNGGKSCTHVALYIGDGQIVHSANSRKGVIVGEADYSPIIGIKNVID